MTERMSQTDNERGYTDLLEVQLSVLNLVKQMLVRMLDDQSLVVSKAALEIVSSLPLTTKGFVEIERKFREFVETSLGIKYVEKVGGNSLVISKKTRPTAERIVDLLHSIDTNIDKMRSLGESTNFRNTVSFATILSVANYLSPALIAVMGRRENHSAQYLAPNLEIEHGELDAQLKLLESRRIDFVISHDVDMSLAKFIGKRTLKFRPDERGLVFRYSWKRSSDYVFPELVEALRSNSKDKVFKAFQCTRIFALSKYSSPQWQVAYEGPLRRLLNSENNLLRQCVTVPTVRSYRQLIQMGLGTGLSHKPTESFNRKIKSGLRLGAKIGTDPEFPEIPLVFVPLSALGIEDPIEKPFAVYFRRADPSLPIDQPNNCDMPPASLEVLNTISDIIEQRHGNCGYLRFQDDELLHNFHFSANDSFSPETIDTVEPRATPVFTHE